MAKILAGDLTNKLRELQLKGNLSDGEMAQKLDCSRQLYQMTRSGKIPPGNKILKGILFSFPELQDDVIYFLSCNANGFPINATKNPFKRLLQPQGRGLRGFCVGLVRMLLRKWKR